MSSPTSRSLDFLRSLGYTCQVVERFNQFSKTRLDLFGVIDIVGVKEDKPGVLGVQATSTGNVKARIDKSLAEDRLRIWLKAGNHFQVWGWAKKGPRGKMKKWTLSRTAILWQNGQFVVVKESDK